MPAPRTLRDLVPPHEPLGEGVESVCEQLEAAGWLPRSRWGDGRSIRYWKDGNRPGQVIIDLRYPMNAHRLEHLSDKTGIELTVEVKED